MTNNHKQIRQLESVLKQTYELKRSAESREDFDTIQNREIDLQLSYRKLTGHYYHVPKQEYSTSRPERR